MIYFTSDLHLGHDREFVWEARGFENVREMTKAIFNGIFIFIFFCNMKCL